MSHFRVVEHTIRCQNVRERAGAVFDGHQNDLRLAVKQYIPLDNPHPQEGDVTLIGAHANGFPKVHHNSHLCTAVRYLHSYCVTRSCMSHFGMISTRSCSNVSGEFDLFGLRTLLSKAKVAF